MKKIQKRNKYLNKKIIQSEIEPIKTPTAIGSEDFEDSITVKWYDELPEMPSDFQKSQELEIQTLKKEAEMVLKKEEEFHSKKNGNSGKSWLQTVLAKGTASDKIAALVVTIQDKPVYNLTALRNLVNMVKISKKKDCLYVMETLTELFHSDLLKPDRRLLKFEQQPLSLLQELSSGNAMTRKKYLCYWSFEDQVKSLYLQFVSAIDTVGRDTIDAHREKAVTAMYKLLSRNPELEGLLLKNLVNKLGDPNQKVVSKVIYSLTQLLREHPLMKQVVANEIEQFIFRPNIGPRAQYYAICFLSQYLFSREDAALAENIISIYFSFFKASIKKGDVDSRMMGALLMGVNRAYPYSKMEQSALSEHVDTLFKLVHICSFNISMQTLCLLYQIVGHTTDRFYCALYKKLLDPHLASSAHQAMFVNLVYKALSKDTNIDRVRVFIKRLLQVCLNGPSQLSCALLYMIAQLIAKRSQLLAITTQKQVIYDADDHSDDDGEERYTDAPLEDSCLGEVSPDNENGETKVDSVEVKEEKKIKPGWFHSKNMSTKVGSKVFDGRARNPAHAGGEFAAYEELVTLASHFHPTVALFARNILDKQQVKYSGDPLQDFTLLRFLERFVFKNPKQAVGDKGPDPCLAHRKHYVASGAKALPINSASFRHQQEQAVPVDELFLYKYLQKRQPVASDKVKSEKEEEEESDVESVASDEFNDMLDSMVGKVGDELDFADDVGDKLRSKKNSKHKQEDSGDSDEDMGEEDDDDAGEDDEDLTDLEAESNEEDDSEAEAIDFDDEGEDFDGEIDLDNLDSESDEDDDFDQNKNKRMPKSKGVPFGGKKSHSLFAPAEQFSEMLEETGASKLKVGTAHDVSNKDNAALKQLHWESKRHHWVHGDRRKRSHSQNSKPSFNKSKRKKR